MLLVKKSGSGSTAFLSLLNLLRSNSQLFTEWKWIAVIFTQQWITCVSKAYFPKQLLQDAIVFLLSCPDWARMVPISLSAPIINLLLKCSIMHMITAKDLHDCTTTSNIDLFKLKNRDSRKKTCLLLFVAEIAFSSVFYNGGLRHPSRFGHW